MSYSFNETEIFLYNIIGFIYIIYYVFNNKLYYSKYVFLKILVFCYIFTLLINILLLQKSYILYWFIETTNIIFMSILIKNKSDNNLFKLKEFMLKCFIIVLIASLVFYFIGKNSVFLGINGMKFTEVSDMINQFNEPRLSWAFYHKSRYALFCYLILYSILERKFKYNVNKSLLLILLFINLYLTSTATTMVASILYLMYWLIKNYKINNKFLKYIIGLISIIVVFIVSYYLISLISETRNIYTIGGRRYIWQSSIELIKQNFIGIIRFPENFSIYNNFYWGQSFTNPHNVFLTNMLLKGYISGTLFCIYLIFIPVVYTEKIDFKVFYLLMIIIIFNMDSVLSERIWGIYSIAIPLFMKSYKGVNYESINYIK